MAKVFIEDISPAYGNVTHAIRQHLATKKVEVDLQDQVDLDKAKKALEDFDVAGKKPNE